MPRASVEQIIKTGIHKITNFVFPDVKVYLIRITYSWSSGRDLDTTTQILLPVVDGPVGWAHQSNNATYLNWYYDDTSTGGTETIDVDSYNIFWNFGGEPEIKFICSANWYSEAGTSCVLGCQTFNKDYQPMYSSQIVAPVTLLQQGGYGQPLAYLTVTKTGVIIIDPI